MLRKGAIIAIVLGAIAGSAQEGRTAQPESRPSFQAPQEIRVSGSVMAGLVEHRTLPRYPDEALRAGIQGDVIFKIVVDETGKTLLSEPVEGNALLVAAGVEALRDFRFRPYLLNGTPVSRVESQIGFHFTVGRKGDEVKGTVECMSTIPYRPEFRTGVSTANGAFVLWPRKLSGPEPKLPPELAGKSGSVYLIITIGVDGKVEDIKVVGGDQPFIDPVVDAAKQFVYEPELVEGKPSVAKIEASYHFGPRD